MTLIGKQQLAIGAVAIRGKVLKMFQGLNAEC
jgi:hypothetical protein